MGTALGLAKQKVEGKRKAEKSRGGKRMDVWKRGNLNRKAHHRVRWRASVSVADLNQHLKIFITN